MLVKSGNFIKRLRHEMFEAKQEIVGLLKDRRGYLSCPYNEFTFQGYEIIKDFLDKDECERLIQLANRYLCDHSYVIAGNCYLLCRNDVQVVDTRVQVITNAQEIDDKLSQLFHSRLIEEMFEQRTGEKMWLVGIRIQVDNLDTRTKRRFHNDGVTPAFYKAFIYLNDVDNYGEGPYTLIPGSHRHTFRKIINHLYNRLTNILTGDKTYPKGDMRLFYSDKESVSIFGKAGTLILSNQQLAHKGWHRHDRKKRYALVCDLVLEKDHNGRAFTSEKKKIKLFQAA
jgi:hypothetical protein